MTTQSNKLRTASEIVTAKLGPPLSIESKVNDVTKAGNLLKTAVEIVMKKFEFPSIESKVDNVIKQHAELFNKIMNEIIGFSSGGLPGNQLSVVTNELIRRLQEQKSQLQTKLPENITELKTLRKKEK